MTKCWLLSLLIGILPLSLQFAAAQNNYVGEIKFVGFNFAPQGWAPCNGQIVPISQNAALFNLIGTYYGGDGVSTFALPNLQGRVPLGMGQGTGLSRRLLGQTGGQEQIYLTGVGDTGFFDDAWGSRNFTLSTMPPFLALNCIIALTGIFPSQNIERPTPPQSALPAASRDLASEEIQGMSAAQISVLIEAIKSFQAQLRSQRAEIGHLKAELDQLKSRLDTR
jgi:microcystin-dependent protein